METLIISFKRKKDYELIKELIAHFDVEIEEGVSLRNQKSKIKSMKDLRKMAGIAKGQLVSKQHLRSLSWKKRS